MDGPPNVIYRIPIRGEDVRSKIKEFFDDKVSKHTNIATIDGVFLRTTDGDSIRITRDYIEFIKYNLQN